ncbi:hypothetical protein Cni_G06365 [Canna indica]|uniref:Uncharacterized protein n=1 Tax=Canna indica TaxID=4628 RepID=A0AAQ3Q6A4_9LILI|nr:hypothetical protein Cni_G06365 [Canna indica]
MASPIVRSPAWYTPKLPDTTSLDQPPLFSSSSARRRPPHGHTVVLLHAARPLHLHGFTHRSNSESVLSHSHLQPSPSSSRHLHNVGESSRAMPVAQESSTACSPAPSWHLLRLLGTFTAPGMYRQQQELRHLANSYYNNLARQVIFKSTT